MIVIQTHTKDFAKIVQSISRITQNGLFWGNSLQLMGEMFLANKYEKYLLLDFEKSLPVQVSEIKLASVSGLIVAVGKAFRRALMAIKMDNESLL